VYTQPSKSAIQSSKGAASLVGRKKLILLFHKLGLSRKEFKKEQITKIRQYNPNAVLLIRIQGKKITHKRKIEIYELFFKCWMFSFEG
jgi:hypothetical protein